MAAAQLPLDPDQFQKDRNVKWNIAVVSGTDKNQNLEEGTGRTSAFDGKAFWNFGNCLSIDSIDKGPNAGFSMDAAFYGDELEPLKIQTGNINTVTGHDFAQPWTGPITDPAPPSDWFYGMDTTNTVQCGPRHRIWEMGNAILKVTLGPEKPIASRFGPLATGPDKIQLRIMTVFNRTFATRHMRMATSTYTASAMESLTVIVGRIPVDNAFDINSYQFMKGNGEWDTQGMIPRKGDTSYGKPGSPVSNSQGSIMYNDYLDTPVGPWSKNYLLLESPDAMRYGVNVHPDLFPQSNGKELLFSWGMNIVLTIYKLSINY